MNLQTINTPPSLSDIELEIIRMSEMLRQGWFAVGTKLLLVERHELYKQGKKKSFTSWLNALSQTLDLKPSTLCQQQPKSDPLHQLNNDPLFFKVFH
jgi:hypothetical protein